MDSRGFIAEATARGVKLTTGSRKPPKNWPKKETSTAGNENRDLRRHNTSNNVDWFEIGSKGDSGFLTLIDSKSFIKRESESTNATHGLWGLPLAKSHIAAVWEISPRSMIWVTIVMRGSAWSHAQRPLERIRPCDMQKLRQACGMGGIEIEFYDLSSGPLVHLTDVSNPAFEWHIFRSLGKKHRR